jgi:hypothetical protein
MKRKSPDIRQSVVTELMTELANLPEREKDPDDLVSLPEIFRSKEYMAEVKAALKKGYTFEKLAEIFSEKCGVAVSERQIKYHMTRGKNRGIKSKSRAKAKAIGALENRASSADSSGKDIAEGVKENVMSSGFSAKHSSEDEEFVSDKDGAMDANPGACVIK